MGEIVAIEEINKVLATEFENSLQNLVEKETPDLFSITLYYLVHIGFPYYLLKVFSKKKRLNKIILNIFRLYCIFQLCVDTKSLFVALFDSLSLDRVKQIYLIVFEKYEDSAQKFIETITFSVVILLVLYFNLIFPCRYYSSPMKYVKRCGMICMYAFALAFMPIRLGFNITPFKILKEFFKAVISISQDYGFDVIINSARFVDLQKIIDIINTQLSSIGGLIYLVKSFLYLAIVLLIGSWTLPVNIFAILITGIIAAYKHIYGTDDADHVEEEEDNIKVKENKKKKSKRSHPKKKAQKKQKREESAESDDEETDEQEEIEGYNINKSHCVKRVDEIIRKQYENTNNLQ